MVSLIIGDYFGVDVVMNCKQLIICMKPDSKLPFSYDNTAAEETNLNPVKLCTAPFHQRKLITFGHL